MDNKNEYLPITGRGISTEYKVSYKVEEDGIVKIDEFLDQYGDATYASKHMIIPKEVFVAVYNAYIKDGE